MNVEPSWEVRPNWRKLVTPQLLRDRPVYKWFVYPHSFDKQLVEDLLQEMHLEAGASVWDPFVGAGTTILACKGKGLTTYGSDLLPLSTFISHAKTRTYDVERIRSAFDLFDYRVQKDTIDRFASIHIVEKSIPLKIRIRISSLLDQIETMETTLRPFFTTALLNILEGLSYSVKSGGWLRLDFDKEIKELFVKELFIAQVGRMILDLQSDERQTDELPAATVWRDDARYTQLTSPVDGIITSPPYLNRHDYTRVFALELALIGVATDQELKAVRYGTLRSHVEARDPELPMAGYQELPALRQALDNIGQQGTNDYRVPRMISGYFEDMFHVLQATSRNLVSHGRAAFVIGDVRFSGVMIPVTDLLVELGRNAGLIPEKVLIARYRGNSAQQMAVYGRKESKESVIIFRKP